jgi:hypothetical protein
MSLARLRLLPAALAFCFAHLLGAQSTYNANEGLIRLDVVVTDPAGNTVSGMSAKDFTLLDDGKPVKILTFRAHEPVTIILLVDTLNLSETLASQERREVDRFLRQNGGHLAQPISLLELSNMGILTVGQPTADGNALAEEFAHNKNVDWIRRLSGGLRGESLDTLLSEPPDCQP